MFTGSAGELRRMEREAAAIAETISSTGQRTTSMDLPGGFGFRRRSRRR